MCNCVNLIENFGFLISFLYYIIIMEFNFELIENVTNLSPVSIKLIDQHILKQIKYNQDYNIYAASCLNYALCGGAVWYFSDILEKNVPWYWWKTEYIILFNQSILAYWSDVLTLGKKSIAHPLDKFFANVIAFGMVFKWFSLGKKYPKEFCINAVLFFQAMYHLHKSQQYYKLHDNRFLLEHTYWHIFTPLMLLYQIYVFGFKINQKKNNLSLKGDIKINYEGNDNQNV